MIYINLRISDEVAPGILPLMQNTYDLYIRIVMAVEEDMG